VLDDVAFFEEDVFEHDTPFRLASRQELQRHGEVLELLLLRIRHDRPGLRIAFERESLLVPTDRLSLLLEGCDDSRKGPDLLAQLSGWFVVLVGRHGFLPLEHILLPSKESRQVGLNSAVGNILIFILVGLIAGFLASRVVTGKGRGWFWDIVIGILGAIFGGWLAGLIHFSIGYGIFGQIVIAFVGALILLLIWRVLFHRRGK